jgi:hypothetical protein
MFRFTPREMPNFSFLHYLVFVDICFGCAAGSIALVEFLSSNNHAPWLFRLALAATAFFAAFVLVRLWFLGLGYDPIPLSQFRAEYRERFSVTSRLQRFLGIAPSGLLISMIVSDIARGGPIWSLGKVNFGPVLVVLLVFVILPPLGVASNK